MANTQPLQPDLAPDEQSVGVAVAILLDTYAAVYPADDDARVAETSLCRFFLDDETP